MVTIKEVIKVAGKKAIVNAVGLSTDIKGKPGNGSRFYEMDTNTEFWYDSQNDEWYEVSGGGPAPEPVYTISYCEFQYNMLQGSYPIFDFGNVKIHIAGVQDAVELTSAEFIGTVKSGFMKNQGQTLTVSRHGDAIFAVNGEPSVGNWALTIVVDIEKFKNATGYKIVATESGADTFEINLLVTVY